MLKIKDLSFSVAVEGSTKRKEILKNINLSVDENKFVVITGPNGSGKSTLARIIMGIEKPSSGSIFLDEINITDLPIFERSKAGICYGFQSPAHFKGMKVKNLLQIAAGKKLKSSQCIDCLTKVGLCSADYLNREVDKSLSGGELKRIEIATILARNPRLAIYDEPEAGIDLWSFERLSSTFKEIHEAKHGNSILIISHQERIINLADELILLEDGQITAQGPKNQVLPLMNFSNMPSNPDCALKAPNFTIDESGYNGK
ncbi:MAG: ATP-binding cassette domain-containing protein [Coriobacteriales bacterium]|nr:ATP-binding cassette domain-containing protein [Coriobacteriales bacterium]